MADASFSQSSKDFPISMPKTWFHSDNKDNKDNKNNKDNKDLRIRRLNAYGNCQRGNGLRNNRILTKNNSSAF